MNRRFAKHLLIVLSVSLLFRSALVDAQGITPTPLAQPVLIFTENAHAVTPLIFTVMSDSTATLAIARSRESDTSVIWQETGKITQAQMLSISAVQQTLSAASNSHWNGDYLFEFPTADGNRKPLELYQGDAQTDASTHDALQKAVQTMLDIRKPFEPLVIFEWSGGFAPRFTQLVIKVDGTATSEDRLGKPGASVQITPTDLQTLRKLLQNVSFASTPRRPSVCADCFVYSISVLTEKGLQTTRVDDSTLGNAPQTLQDLVALLRNLSDQVTSPKPTPTPTPQFPDCCNNSVKPGEDNTWIGGLKQNDVLIAAAQLLQLQPNVVPTPCAVVVLRGPMAYDISLIDGYWIDIEQNPTDQVVAAITQSAIDTVAKDCGKDKVKIIHVP